jgi:NTP pyrophosphatase (non-canonical NTP hydrolase)
MNKFAELAEKELSRARALHPGKQHSLHEGYSVLLEEVDEFWDEVKRKSEQRSRTQLLKELVQVAAMAQRTAEDLGLVE